jgi:hypothetical protein
LPLQSTWVSTNGTLGRSPSTDGRPIATGKAHRCRGTLLHLLKSS